MNEELKRDLVDDEGENQALRSFLMQYSCDRSITVGQMRQHMARSGWGATYCPPFVNNSTATAGEHLTKSGAQIWIRHLIDLERRTPVSGEAQAEVAAYQVQSSEDGKWYGVSKEQWDSASPAYRRALPAKTGTLDHPCPKDTPYGPSKQARRNWNAATTTATKGATARKGRHEQG